MAHSLQDFYAKLHWEETLPASGLVVLLRKPDLFALIGLGELPIPSTAPAQAAPEAAPSGMTGQDVNRYIERIIAEGVISPRFSDVRDDQGRPVYSQTEYIHVSELSTMDRNFLSKRLFEEMGLTEEGAQAAQAFRADELRPVDTAAGPGV